MKTPFTLHFGLAVPLLTCLRNRPFAPSHPMPFVAADATVYYAGDGCQLIYRWYDAFNVFVAVLEAYLPAAAAVELRVESHLHDLYLVYQLAGHSAFRAAAPLDSHALHLPRNHHVAVYTPPASAVVRIVPDRQTHRYALATCVPKGKWLTRHVRSRQNPFDELLLYQKQQLAEYRYLRPSPISHHMHTWLHLLLTMPRHAGIFMDYALQRPVAHLVALCYDECKQAEHDGRSAALVDTARQLIQKLVARMDGSQPPPTVGQVAATLQTTPRRLRELHRRLHGHKLIQHITACRIEEAKRRLSTGHSIAAVAYGLGWA
ncbi:helix-turn-helix domain-containing protein, partial [Parapedobacter composti]